jgi:hypothetical protein
MKFQGMHTMFEDQINSATHFICHGCTPRIDLQHINFDPYLFSSPLTDRSEIFLSFSTDIIIDVVVAAASTT